MTMTRGSVRAYSDGYTRASNSNLARQSSALAIERTSLILAFPLARVIAAANCENGFSPASPRRIQWLNADSDTLLASQAVRIVHASEMSLHNSFVFSGVHNVLRPGLFFVPPSSVFMLFKLF